MTKVREKNKKHILIVSDTWGNINGINTIYLSLFKKFKNNPNLVITLFHPSHEEKIIQLYPNIFIYSHRPLFFFKLPFYKEISQGLPRKNSLLTIEKKIGKIDIIHFCTQGLFGLFFARLAKKHKITSTGFYHTFMPLFIEYYYPWPLNKLFIYLFKKIDQATFNHCQAMIVHTKETQDYISRYLKVKKYYFSTNFLSNQDKQKRNLLLNKKILKLVMLAELAKKKISFLYCKLKRIKNKNIDLVFIGDGPLKNKMYNKTKNYFRFTGYLKKEALWKEIKKLDFVIIPSLTDTLNMTLLEAAYYGIPAIVIQNTVPAAIIKKNNSGIIIDDIKNKGWLDLVVDKYNSKEYQKLSLNSSKLGKKSHIDNAVKLFLSIWDLKK